MYASGFREWLSSSGIKACLEVNVFMWTHQNPKLILTFSPPASVFTKKKLMVRWIQSALTMNKLKALCLLKVDKMFFFPTAEMLQTAHNSVFVTSLQGSFQQSAEDQHDSHTNNLAVNMSNLRRTARENKPRQPFTSPCVSFAFGGAVLMAPFTFHRCYSYDASQGSLLGCISTDSESTQKT